MYWPHQTLSYLQLKEMLTAAAAGGDSGGGSRKRSQVDAAGGHLRQGLPLRPHLREPPLDPRHRLLPRKRRSPRRTRRSWRASGRARPQAHHPLPRLHGRLLPPRPPPAHRIPPSRVARPRPGTSACAGPGRWCG
jgi:hypothetical protein